MITATLAALLAWWEAFRGLDGPRPVAAPDSPCHCGAVNAGPVSAGTRRVCLLLAVIGTLVLMAGVLLAVSSTVLGQGPGGSPVVPAVAAGLIVGGLLCGVIMVAVTVPGGQRTSGRMRRPEVGPPHPHRPDPSQEWMDALRSPGRRSGPGPAPMPVRRPGDSDRAG